MERAEQRENMSKKCNNTTGGWSYIPMRERNWKGLTRPHIEVSNPRVHDREGLMAMGDIQWSVSPLERFNDWFGISEGAQVATVAEYSARGYRDVDCAKGDTKMDSANALAPILESTALIIAKRNQLPTWKS